jgi:hypothetical protein
MKSQTDFKTSVDTGSPEHFVEYGSKHWYTHAVKKQCLINHGLKHKADNGKLTI